MATVLYKTPKEDWGNPTWDSEKVKSIMEFEGNYYHAVDSTYAKASDGFEAIVPEASPTTNKYLLNRAIALSPKIGGDADKASAMGISDGGSESAIATDKAKYEAE
jgi:hypothetical protein